MTGDLPVAGGAIRRARAPRWRVRGAELALDRPIVAGVVNTTPDSFSDGGRFLSFADACAYAERLIAEGADILDVGGESTRPQGAVQVSAEEELRRVIPVVAELARRHPSVLISVDTTKSAVAAAALDAGAHIINDVSGLRLDARMGEIVAERGAGLVLMHSRGGVSDMATFAHAVYDDVVADVERELRERIVAAARAGVDRETIALDPGIGFAKRGAQSLAILAALPRIVALGLPVMVGVSRKRFIGEITGVTEPSERIHGTVGANVVALTFGARIFRVHDVRANREALDVAWAILQGGETV